MANIRGKNLLEILKNPKFPLQKLLKNLQLLGTIDRHCQTFLLTSPGTFKATQLNQGCLTISVENASMATLLRYQSSKLLSHLRTQKQLQGLSSIEITILPPQDKKITLKQKKKKQQQKPSRSSIECLKELAGTIEDETLSKSLLKLHQTLGRSID